MDYTGDLNLTPAPNRYQIFFWIRLLVKPTEALRGASDSVVLESLIRYGWRKPRLEEWAGLCWNPVYTLTLTRAYEL